jgi:hypothetical protein
LDTFTVEILTCQVFRITSFLFKKLQRLNLKDILLLFFGICALLT